MSTGSQFVACPEIQMGIVQAFAGNTNNAPYSNAALVRFLKSDVNTNNVLVEAIKAEGYKLKQAKVVWSQRYTPEDAQEGLTVGCAEGEVIGELSQTYTLDALAGVEISERISPGLLRERCEADNLWLAKRVNAMFDVLGSKAEAYIASVIALNTGYFSTDVDNGNPAGTTTEKTVFKYETAGGNLVTKPYETIIGDAEDNGFRMPPVVFGGRVWADYARAMKAVGLNSQGQDLAEYIRQNMYIFEQSREVASAFNNPKAAVAIAPGSVQILDSNYTQSPLVTMDDDALKIGTLTHPVLPITADYIAKFEPCSTAEHPSGYWDITLKWNFDLAFMPDDMFKADDRLFGVNGINKYVLEECGTLCPDGE